MHLHVGQGSGSWPRNSATPNIIKAIVWLKHKNIYRNKVAHPMPVILKEAEQAIIEMSKSYHSKQFPQTKDFVMSIKTML